MAGLPIVGVPTAVTAFLGRARAGPVGVPVPVGDLAEFKRLFGAVAADLPLGPAVRDFFTNGGREALVVRVVAGDGRAAGNEPLAEEDLLGREGGSTGLRALAGAGSFNLLCIPADPPGGGVTAVVLGAALELCLRRRAMLLVDPPPAWTADPARAAEAAGAGLGDLGLEGAAAGNAALYFPRLLGSAPAPGARAVPRGPGGAVAGVVARNDEERGVWKAPAGREADVRGVGDLEVELDARDQELLNPRGVNTLRSFPGLGPLIWGARTLAAGDHELRYVPVRRFLLFLEASIDRGLEWAVFEPDDRRLWAAVRRRVEDFLRDLFRRGALVGVTPEQAFFVRCDESTMTQDDIDAGRLVVEVGVAPLRPAEFVILRFGRRVGEDPDAALAAAGERVEVTEGAAALPAPARGEVEAVAAAEDGLALVAAAAVGSRLRLAAAVAAGLGLALYRVDLRRVLGEHIGETEKNLRRLFAAAESAGALLFFDEADALFGRRGAVEDAHDRLADQRIDLLLARGVAGGVRLFGVADAAAVHPPLLGRFAHRLRWPDGAGGGGG